MLLLDSDKSILEQLKSSSTITSQDSVSLSKSYQKAKQSSIISLKEQDLEEPLLQKQTSKLLEFKGHMSLGIKVKSDKDIDYMTLNLQSEITNSLASITYAVQQKEEVLAEEYSEMWKDHTNPVYEQKVSYDLMLNKNEVDEHVRITEYCPAIFRQIQILSDFEEIIPLLDSLDLKSNYPAILRHDWTLNISKGEAQGNSGSFLFVTHDKALLLKVISKSELDFCLDFLPFFYNHLNSTPDSYLSRMLGLFQIDSSTTSKFYIMLQKTCLPEQCALKFDLKGSEDGRQVIKKSTSPEKVPRQVSKSETYKDLDFVKMMGTIEISSQERQEIISTLRQDCELLRTLNVIDYSLLIGFTERDFKAENVMIQFGIIDYLQTFNCNKYCAYTWKRCICRENFSVIPPDQYAARFIRFMEGIFVVGTQTSVVLKRKVSS